MRVLFVCTGNICRSPMAEALARRLLDERGHAEIGVGSAGTAAADGTPASEGAYLVGLEKGLDLADHVARFLTSELVAESDLILTMGVHHIGRVESLGGAGKTWLLGTYAGRADDEAEVEDPFGGTLDDYRDTYSQLYGLMVDAVDRLLREAEAK